MAIEKIKKKIDFEKAKKSCISPIISVLPVKIEECTGGHPLKINREAYEDFSLPGVRERERKISEGMKEMKVNPKEINIHPTREEEEEDEENERCVKASQSPCFPSAPKFQMKQESLPLHTNPFLPSSSSWEDCFPPPSHHHDVFLDNVLIPRQSSNPFLPPSTAADDPCPVLYEALEKSHEDQHGPNSSDDLPGEEKEKKEVPDSGGDADQGLDQDQPHHHKKWFSFPKLDPRHRWPQGWC